MNKDTLYVKRKRPTDMLLLAAIYVSATLAVALLLGIILYVFVKGIRTVNWAFLTTVTSARKQTTGIAGNLLNTLYIIVITLLIATPIGVGSAIYLNEYAKPGKLVSLIEFTQAFHQKFQSLKLLLLLCQVQLLHLLFRPLL